MERLTERFSNGEVGVLGCGDNCKYEFKHCENRAENCPAFWDIYKKLADYEDAEEQGLLLRLPIAIGSDVYFIPSKVNYDLNVLHHHEECNRVYHQKIARIHFIENGWYVEGNLNLEYGVVDRIFVDKLYKETWFLTKEEAEQALKQMGE